MSERLQLHYRPLADLLPYARNSRTHSDEQIAQIAGSIREFGFTNPILVDPDGGIIAGHGRARAAALLKLEVVPCIELGHLTQTQRKAYVIADNRLALNAGWDSSMLTLELQDLQSNEFDLGLLGFDSDELEALLNPEVAPAEGLGDPDDMPEQVETRCKPGDLWILGKHRLLCGDSTNVQHVERLMGGELADCVWTDPPYNVAYEGKTKDALTIKNDKMGADDFRQFLRDAFSAMAGVTKAGGGLYIAHADSEGENFRGAARESGWLVKQCLVWVKSCLVMGRQDYQWKHEPILYGWRNGGPHSWHSDRKQTTVLEFDKPQRNGDHPTMKPVELVAYCLRNSTRPSDVVLDLFGGSGTTLIASEQLARHARLMELDPKYCDVILARWEKFTGQTAVREEADAC